ncbi:MAG: hypothetical protein EBR95_08675 [Verrucomicrobia bacterium]|jgi:hypothetical protein|nr:hypothetical protein [Verrucomicrobiota bacterium]
MDPRLPTLGLAGVDFALAAVCWLILLCTYPDFARWRAEGFAAAHDAYTRKVGWVIGPLLALQMVGHLAVAYLDGAYLGLALVVVCWALTAGWSVPCHRRLRDEGPASPALDGLIRSHRWRTALWTLTAMDSIGRASG